jgi:hypothetical protein
MLAFALLPLLGACTSRSSDDETGDPSVEELLDTMDTDQEPDTDTQDSGTPVQSVLIQEWFGTCPDAECRWEIAADGQIGAVELELIETGDPSYDCGQATQGQLVCGVWTEYHTNFALTEEMNAYGGETKSIVLDLVDSYHDQVNNQSTLFDNRLIASTVTYMLVITSADGLSTDCIVDGHDPSHFSSVCANLF